ncbi:MAG: hypothetical protein OXN92_08355 [Gammaproteobacteria bacterium]|nr:hypothetical protein [Gammaproteobacteria bacterium]
MTAWKGQLVTPATVVAASSTGSTSRTSERADTTDVYISFEMWDGGLALGGKVVVFVWFAGEDDPGCSIWFLSADDPFCHAFAEGEGAYIYDSSHPVTPEQLAVSFEVPVVGSDPFRHESCVWGGFLYEQSWLPQLRCDGRIIGSNDVFSPWEG